MKLPTAKTFARAAIWRADTHLVAQPIRPQDQPDRQGFAADPIRACEQACRASFSNDEAALKACLRNCR